MRDDTPSRTAAWVAAARQLGQLLPDDLRLVDDPYGAAFTSRWLASLIEQATAGDDSQAPLDIALRRLRGPLAQMPGLQHWILYMQVRTRVIDDAIRAFARGGGRQLVLLGAGYDCRALRMPELLGARVFEIDHPATQGHKRQTLARLGAASPATYVTWNFEERPLEDLPEELAASGHDAARPSFTVWEGVTMYLSEPAIDASLRAIVEWSAPGSRLAMTYFAKARLAQPSLATRALRAVTSRLGEPWRFGWDPDELPGYLAERGLELTSDLAISDAARELLPPELAAQVYDPERRAAFAKRSGEAIAQARR
ncbi:MAG TPA: SAM-dependent methyltransferase [Kofleriaceae bacterium]|nr:SAM-dependent methyltransferase [Kofleriaceae bacterium]